MTIERCVEMIKTFQLKGGKPVKFTGEIPIK